VFRVVNQRIYSPDGSFLKHIFCEKRAGLKDLTQQGSMQFSCAMCEKVVHNTDFLTEQQFMVLLRDQPDACLYISKGNRMFEVDEWK
jgi:hypothetical protein